MMADFPAFQRFASIAFAASCAAMPQLLRAQAWSLDPAFAPRIGYDSPTLLYASFVAGQNGQFYVHGDVTHINDRPAPNLARLNSDGLLDQTFVFEIGADERIIDVAPLTDGRSIVLVGTRRPMMEILPVPRQPNPSGLPGPGRRGHDRNRDTTAF